MKLLVFKRSDVGAWLLGWIVGSLAFVPFGQRVSVITCLSAFGGATGTILVLALLRRRWPRLP